MIIKLIDIIVLFQSAPSYIWRGRTSGWGWMSGYRREIIRPSLPRFIDQWVVQERSQCISEWWNM